MCRFFSKSKRCRFLFVTAPVALTAVMNRFKLTVVNAIAVSPKSNIHNKQIKLLRMEENTCGGFIVIKGIVRFAYFLKINYLKKQDSPHCINLL